MKIEEEDSFWELFCVGLSARVFHCKEFFKTLWNYWSDWQFMRQDLALTLRYFWKSPYRLNRERGLELYGETPFSTMKLIAKRAKITPQDIVYELGSGRGRLAFWLHHFYKCKVYAVEYNPLFVANAKLIQQKYGVDGIEFQLGDMKKMDMSKATCIYLYGTLLEDEDIRALIERFKKLKKGVRFITISYPLTEYDNTTFRLLSEFEVAFPWGKTSAYLHDII